MISYEIKKKSEAAPIVHIRDIVRQVKDKIHHGINLDAVSEELRRQANQAALAEGEKPSAPWMPIAARPAAPTPGGISAIGMGKHQYNKWLNDFVYPRFPVGTRVTLRQNAFVMGRLPYWWATVKEIQEVYYMCQIDRLSRDPLALYIESAHSVEWYPPANLRPLTEEENRIINDCLRDKTPIVESSTTATDGEGKVDPASSS